MHVLNVRQVGSNYEYKWPSNQLEMYAAWIEYDTRAEDGKHILRIGFGRRPVYGIDRARIVVWIDGHPHAEFLGADDFDATGDVLSEIRIRGDVGEPMCRYPNDTVPERYTTFDVVGLPTRVSGKGVHSAWAVVTNVSNHKVIIDFAVLRQQERTR